MGYDRVLLLDEVGALLDQEVVLFSLDARDVRGLPVDHVLLQCVVRVVHDVYAHLKVILRPLDALCWFLRNGLLSY